MEIIDSNKVYESPQARVFNLNVQSVLCESRVEGTPRYGEEELKPGIFG